MQTIEYSLSFQSSDQIYDYNYAYEAGVPLNQLSTMLGHSETRTTLHYIRQQSVDPKSSTIMINTLDTDLSDSNPANP